MSESDSVLPLSDEIHAAEKSQNRASKKDREAGRRELRIIGRFIRQDYQREASKMDIDPDVSTWRQMTDAMVVKKSKLSPDFAHALEWYLEINKRLDLRDPLKIRDPKKLVRAR